MTHDFFKIDSDEQGSGFGSEFFFHSEEAYTNYGISEIKVHANITVGGYAWARMGFDFDSDDVRQDFADTISTDWMRQSRLDFANKTKKDIFSPDFNESHERWIEHLGENESIFPPYLDDAPAWEHAATVYESPFDGNVIKIGKTAMLNSDWYGTKDLWGDGVEAGDLYYATKKNR